MADWDRLKGYWTDRNHAAIAMVIATNLVVVAALTGAALLLLLAGIYALHWLEVLPCLCA